MLLRDPPYERSGRSSRALPSDDTFASLSDEQPDCRIEIDDAEKECTRAMSFYNTDVDVEWFRQHVKPYQRISLRVVRGHGAKAGGESAACFDIRELAEKMLFLWKDERPAIEGPWGGTCHLNHQKKELLKQRLRYYVSQEMEQLAKKLPTDPDAISLVNNVRREVANLWGTEIDDTLLPTYAQAVLLVQSVPFDYATLGEFIGRVSFSDQQSHDMFLWFVMHLITSSPDNVYMYEQLDAIFPHLNFHEKLAVAQYLVDQPMASVSEIHHFLGKIHITTPDEHRIAQEAAHELFVKGVRLSYTQMLGTLFASIRRSLMTMPSGEDFVKIVKIYSFEDQDQERDTLTILSFFAKKGLDFWPDLLHMIDGAVEEHDNVLAMVGLDKLASDIRRVVNVDARRTDTNTFVVEIQKLIRSTNGKLQQAREMLHRDNLGSQEQLQLRRRIDVLHSIRERTHRIWTKTLRQKPLQLEEYTYQ